MALEPIAQREAAEAQSLLLGGQVEPLRVELLLELALEVVEQLVPAHAATVAIRSRAAPALSTG